MKTEIVKLNEECIDEDAINKAGTIIKNGGLVAFPTETVYGLGGDALNEASSGKIYAAKGRPSDNPLIVHIADMESIEIIASEIPDKARLLGEKLWPGPLTMILKKKAEVPYATTGGLETVAVRFPSNKIACALIKASGGFVAAPSANISGRPSTTKAAHVIEDMNGRIDMILDGGDCNIGLESTIVDFTCDPPAILRPGYYNKEQLSGILGEVGVDPVVKKGYEETDQSGREKPKAPGMKYKHYAPKGEILLVEGDEEKVINTINSLEKEKAEAGFKTAVICCDETFSKYKGENVFSLGSRYSESQIAHKLFDVLREADDLDIRYIYSEVFDTPELGKAIMNRLFKAAGFNILKV